MKSPIKIFAVNQECNKWKKGCCYDISYVIMKKWLPCLYCMELGIYYGNNFYTLISWNPIMSFIRLIWGLIKNKMKRNVVIAYPSCDIASGNNLFIYSTYLINMKRDGYHWLINWAMLLKKLALQWLSLFYAYFFI